MNNIIIDKVEKLQKDVSRLEVMQSNMVNYVQPYFYNEPGTITVSGTAVTGTDTSFTAADVGRDIFWSPSTGVFVWIGRIATFTSATSVTLSTSYSGSAITNQSFHLMYSPNQYFINEPGTITVSGTAVTGTNTSFTAADVGRDIFWSPSTGVFVWIGRIATFTSATSVTLSTSYSGSAITNQSFHLSTAPGLGTILYPSTLTINRQSVTFTANVAQTITWQFLTRNTTNSITQVPFPITLPTSQIVIPQAGYYMITLYTSYSVATQAVMQISINGAFPTSSVGSVATVQLHSFSAMQYFEQNDYFEINLRYTVSGTLQTNNERTVNQSPYLYVARIA